MALSLQWEDIQQRYSEYLQHEYNFHCPGQGRKRGFIMNTNGYDERQISKNNRRLNGIEAFEIVSVDGASREVTLRRQCNGETVRIRPSDFEITDYRKGMFCDLTFSTMNGRIRSAQLIGMTPLAFVPQE